ETSPLPEGGGFLFPAGHDGREILPGRVGMTLGQGGLRVVNQRLPFDSAIAVRRGRPHQGVMEHCLGLGGFAEFDEGYRRIVLDDWPGKDSTSSGGVHCADGAGKRRESLARMSTFIERRAQTAQQSK